MEAFSLDLTGFSRIKEQLKTILPIINLENQHYKGNCLVLKESHAAQIVKKIPELDVNIANKVWKASALCAMLNRYGRRQLKDEAPARKSKPSPTPARKPKPSPMPDVNTKLSGTTVRDTIEN
ncbi:hypothetical protein PMIN07_012440 [Paraphaeosphaeria minitans]